MADKRLLKIGISWLPITTCKRLSLFLTVVFFTAVLTGCSGATTTFRVLDARTKEPIEGAVALAMWDRTRGLPGLTSRYTAYALEAESDVNGILQIQVEDGEYAIYTPRLKIYKPGYVGWDSKLIYLGVRDNDPKRARFKRREGFSMKDQDVFLEPWKDEFTFISHSYLINTPPDIYEAGLKKSKYEKAIEYEDPFRGLERRKLNK